MKKLPNTACAFKYIIKKEKHLQNTEVNKYVTGKAYTLIWLLPTGISPVLQKVCEL